MNWYRLFFLFIAALGLFALSGCSASNKRSNYDAFYATLVSEDGNYCFRGLAEDMSWNEVRRLEKLEHEKIGSSIYESYVTEDAIYFDDLDVSFRRGYTFNERDQLKGASYIFIAKDETQLKAVCEKLSDFAEKKLTSAPETGSAKMLAILPTLEELKEHTESTTRWYDKSENGASLEFYVNPRIANGKRVRINITYEKVIPYTPSILPE